MLSFPWAENPAKYMSTICLFENFHSNFLLNPGNKNTIPSLFPIFQTYLGNNVYTILCLLLKRSHFTRKIKAIAHQDGPTQSYSLLDLRETQCEHKE